MARYFEPNEQQTKLWQEWLATRPPNIRRVAEQFDPWTLYQLKSTGHRVTIHSFSGENDVGPVTITVSVTGQFNIVGFERNVFGIKPEDLVECDLPNDDEFVGAAIQGELTNDQIGDLCLMIRPDLWERGEDGQAHRKIN